MIHILAPLNLDTQIPKEASGANGSMAAHPPGERVP